MNENNPNEIEPNTSAMEKALNNLYDLRLRARAEVHRAWLLREKLTGEDIPSAVATTAVEELIGAIPILDRECQLIAETFDEFERCLDGLEELI